MHGCGGFRGNLLLSDFGNGRRPCCPIFDVAQLASFMLENDLLPSIISHLLFVLGAAALSAALRSFEHRLLFRLGTLGIVVTSFLAGWLLGGSVALGAALAASWLFLPWLEILTRVRRMRIPIERRLAPRTPRRAILFPVFRR